MTNDRTGYIQHTDDKVFDRLDNVLRQVKSIMPTNEMPEEIWANEHGYYADHRNNSYQESYTRTDLVVPRDVLREVYAALDKHMSGGDAETDLDKALINLRKHVEA